MNDCFVFTYAVPHLPLRQRAWFTSHRRSARPATFLALAWAIFVLTTLAAATAHATDAGDGKDHALLTGMPGYKIGEKSVKDFDAVVLEDFKVKGSVNDAKFPLRYEGKVTVIRYFDPEQRTSNLLVYRNYVNALKKAGAQQLNTGVTESADEVRLGNHVFSLPSKSGGTPTMVLLYINSPQWYSITYVEPRAMEQSVRAGELADEIKSKGFATLYINFDTDRSDLKSDGEAAVKEVAAMLKADPSLKLSIDGHTDNVGATAANVKLSGDRARSVMKALVASGIDASRLSAKGLGASVPVADNRTDEGRAKNRRVELVKAKP